MKVNGLIPYFPIGRLKPAATGGVGFSLRSHSPEHAINAHTCPIGG